MASQTFECHICKGDDETPILPISQGRTFSCFCETCLQCLEDTFLLMKERGDKPFPCQTCGNIYRKNAIPLPLPLRVTAKEKELLDKWNNSLKIFNNGIEEYEKIFSLYNGVFLTPSDEEFSSFKPLKYINDICSNYFDVHKRLLITKQSLNSTFAQMNAYVSGENPLTTMEFFLKELIDRIPSIPSIEIPKVSINMSDSDGWVIESTTDICPRVDSESIVFTQGYGITWEINKDKIKRNEHVKIYPRFIQNFEEENKIIYIEMIEETFYEKTYYRIYRINDDNSLFFSKKTSSGTTTITLDVGHIQDRTYYKICNRCAYVIHCPELVRNNITDENDNIYTNESYVANVFCYHIDGKKEQFKIENPQILNKQWNTTLYTDNLVFFDKFYIMYYRGNRIEFYPYIE